MRDLASLRATDFLALVGTAFVVVDGDEAAIDLRLTEVVIPGERPGHRQPFSLRFLGPCAPLLEQATHRLVHAELGALELFLGPIASGSEGTIYEAVFG
jgi:hypothetical protein